MDGEAIRTKLVQSDVFARAFHLQAEERKVYVCAHHVAITHVVPHDHATKKLHRVSVQPLSTTALRIPSSAACTPQHAAK